jgi:hypothetical protein
MRWRTPPPWRQIRVALDPVAADTFPQQPQAVVEPVCAHRGSAASTKRTAQLPAPVGAPGLAVTVVVNDGAGSALVGYAPRPLAPCWVDVAAELAATSTVVITYYRGLL